jgi:hypothetical protein
MVLVQNINKIDLDNVELSNIIYSGSDIKYANILYKNEKFYFSAPSLTLDQDIIIKNGICYIKFIENMPEFSEMITQIDKLILLDIYHNRSKWFNDSISIIEIESKFISTIKLSICNPDIGDITFKSPIELIEVFDKNNNIIDITKLYKNDIIIPLFHIKDVCVTEDYIYVNWLIRQLKLKNEKPIKLDYQLGDIVDDDSDNEDGQ